MERGKGARVILTKVTFRLSPIKTRRHRFPLLPNPFPEPKHCLLNPNPNNLLIFLHNLYASQRIPLPPLLHLLNPPLQPPHRPILLLHRTLFPNLSNLLYLPHYLLINFHVLVHVPPHYLVFEQVHLPVLEREQLAEEVLLVLFVLGG